MEKLRNAIQHAWTSLDARPRRLALLIAGALVLAVGLVYWKSLEADFVAWDDDINVYANPHVQGLDLQRVSWMFTDTQGALRYKPLSWLAWAGVYTCVGLDPFGFHLANIILHCANTVLLFGAIFSVLSLIQRKSATPVSLQLLVSGWGALVWAIHPWRVEPVSWVTGLPY